jgi:serine/threonine-protein kinase RsbW
MTTGTTLPATWSRAFSATPAQIREARRFLAGILPASPAADDAILCLSELATNATLHSNSGKSGGHFTVRATMPGGRLRVEVQDEGGPWTCPERGDGQHGRGLFIVAELARGWGRTGDSATGWTVWFEMDCSSPARPVPESPPTAHQLPPVHHTEEGTTTMTEPATSTLAQYDPQQMRLIAATLTAAGLTTHLTDSRAGLDLTATPRSDGKREAEFWIDEDGYAELRFWYPPSTPPTEVTATALRVLHAANSTASHTGAARNDCSPGR